MAPAPERNLAAAPRRKNLIRGAMISSLAVFGSRLMGLVREQTFAFFFGASREYDAFLTAFRIPNLLRDLLAEGALSTAFVACFSRELATHDRTRAYRLANLTMNLLVLVLGAICVLGIWQAPLLVRTMAVGFDPQKTELTVHLVRLMFPFILFVALAAVTMGMLNAQERFALPQSASTFFNITSILGGLTFAFLFAPAFMRSLWQGAPLRDPIAAARAMEGMALGTLLGGLVQWLVQIPTLLSLGFRWHPIVSLKDPALREVLRLMAPAIIGAAAVQLGVFINSNFASLLGDKPISWLNYAFRLMQFPIGVFGVAIMSSSLPSLARHAGNRDMPAFGDTLTDALELVMVLCVPATAGLIFGGEPILRLIYERGRFGPTDTIACAHALAAYGIGLPAYAAIKVIQPALMALNRARATMVVSLVAVACGALSNWAMIRVAGLGHVGLALSTSLLALGNVTALLFILASAGPSIAYRRVAFEVGKVLLATLGMVIALVSVRAGFGAMHLRRTSAAAFLEVAVILGSTGPIYFYSVLRLNNRAAHALRGMRRGSKLARS